MMDNLYAFWGCIDDEVDDEENRNINKVGRYVERLDFTMRLKMEYRLVNKAFRKLQDRIRRLRHPYNDDTMYHLTKIMEKKEGWEERFAEALLSVNSLFPKRPD